MFSDEFDSIATDHPELSRRVYQFRDFLGQLEPQIPFRLEDAVDGLKVSLEVLNRLAELLCQSNVLVAQMNPVCTGLGCYGNSLEKIDAGKLSCDLCERTYERNGAKMEKFHVLNSVVSNAEKNQIETCHAAKKESGSSGFFIEKMSPWGRDIVHSEITASNVKIHEIEIADILRRVEKYGICRFKLIGHSPSDDVLRFLQKHIGPANEQQNDFDEDIIKKLKPRPDGPENSGEAIGDLDPHVDGTQDPVQPALLVFQFIVGAEYGGSSEFIDMARVLEDIEEPYRTQLILNLSRKDAATFSKKGMIFTGPIFQMKSEHRGVAVRLRTDNVISIHDACKAHFEFLKQRIEDQRYRLTFLSSKGDIVIFDNWRLLHSRDRVRGDAQREHNRMWITDLTFNNRTLYNLGLRFASIQLLANIQRANS